ncbi:MAG: hypothetical protein ACOZBL_03260 [Patescibacteria group bacterium]
MVVHIHTFQGQVSALIAKYAVVLSFLIAKYHPHQCHQYKSQLAQLYHEKVK